MATLAGAQTSTYAGATVWRVILEWLTTVDHKKIGIMYLWTAGAFGLVGMAFSLVMRTELAETGTIISAETYNSIFTMHGSVMIFLFLLPIGAAFMNYSMPLQIGALDMAFPRINALSFWIFLFGGVLLTLSFAAEGGTASAGWTAYPPVTLDTGNNAEPPGAGMDMWLVGVILLGQASIFGSVNFLVTIFKMRAPGMTMWRLPLFTWTTLVTGLLILLSTPVLAAALVLGFIDRNGAGGAFFDPAAGGQPLLWQNLFWFYSHPAVYIMILPAMGIVSDVFGVFTRRPVFGYRSMVLALIAIGLLGFIVWAHHMFTTGGVFLPFFMGATFLIAVPTGVKMFNWITTMWRGSNIFPTAMLFSVGFLMLFLIGGITGVFHAAVPVDFALHDTYFVVGHFHYTMSIAATFGFLAGCYYWFPKMFGKFMNEGLGKLHFWLVFIGVNLIFFTQLLLGLDGMPRRINDYVDNPGWELMNMLTTIGAFVSAAGMMVFLYNVFYSLKWGERAGSDPWEGTTLEWATTSPPPAHNFDSLPEIRSERPLFDLRFGERLQDDPHYHVNNAHNGNGSGSGAKAPTASAREEG